jgi:hypothetical protein
LEWKSEYAASSSRKKLWMTVGVRVLVMMMLEDEQARKKIKFKSISSSK